MAEATLTAPSGVNLPEYNPPGTNPPATNTSLEFRRALRGIEVLEPLPEREIEGLASRLPALNFEKGKILFTPEHRSSLIFFLCEGSVRIYKESNVRELTLEIVSAGSMFSNTSPGGESGEGLMLDVYAQAVRPSRVAMIRREHFSRLVRQYPKVGLKALEISSRRLAFYGERMMDIATREVPARLARLLIHLVHEEGLVCRDGFKIPTRYTHEDLATVVGSRRVAITRAFRELGHYGVETRGRHVHVSDLEALKRAAL